MIRHYLVALLAVLLVACTTIGNKFDPAAVDRLQPGVSTTADATAALGKPSSESAIGPNRLLQWQYSQGSMFGANGAHVAILFDQSGRMIRVQHRSQI